MRQLQEAIVRHFNASAALYSLLNGRLFFEFDPALELNKPPDFPFAVFRFISHVPSWNFGREEMETYRVRFNLVSDEFSSDQVNDLYQALTDAFSFASPSVDGYSLTYCVKRASSIERLDMPPLTWQYAVDYEIRIQAE